MGPQSKKAAGQTDTDRRDDNSKMHTEAGHGRPVTGISGFVIRLTALLAAVLVLCGYEAAETVRAKDAQILSLQTQLSEAQTQRDKLEDGIKSISDEIRAAGIGNDELGSMESAAETESAGGLKDGQYEGQSQGYGGIVKVQVTVSGGQITNIDVSEHDGEDAAYFEIASRTTIQRVIDAQSADVDAVTGATLTSNGIINAVREALEDAGTK